MASNRDELFHLIEGLPNDQVDVLLADARRMTSATPRGEWPPRFFGIGVDKEGRTDNAWRVDEILAVGFGAPRGVS